MAIKFNPDMNAAPRDRRILALRAGGQIGIVIWDAQKSHKHPKPYWSDDRERVMGIAWCRANEPICWAELEAEA